MYGPIFMGNPLACAVACESIELLLESDWQSNVARIETKLEELLGPLRSADYVADVRVLGAIGVVELENPVSLNDIQPALVEEGIWLRPFGKLVYMMPPFNMSDEELSILCNGTANVLETLHKK
jgi:adenosylmethionine-8-amino-7-oxononanoate aminotransferase